MGTLFIYGCVLYVFSDYNYQGDMHTYKGPFSSFNGPDLFHTCNGGIPCANSFSVECEMSMPDCAPSDAWISVAYLDNAGSSIPTKFTYQYTIGTEWSTEVSQGFNVDVSVTTTIQAAFFEIFSAEVSTSFSTGYNWQSTSSEARSEETSYTIETEVPAGAIIRIEQARGLCGASEVKTEMFRHTDMKTGKSKIIMA